MRLLVDDLFIKVSGVTTEEDALFSIGLGASAVGFEFGPTPRQIAAETSRTTSCAACPRGADSVGVFRSEMPQRIVEIANTLGLSAVQIEGAMTRRATSPTWPSGSTRSFARCRAPGHRRGADGVGGRLPGRCPSPTTTTSLVDCLEHLPSTRPIRTPLIASGGLTASNVVDVVQNYPVWGVDVRAGVEVAPGVKDPVLLGEFIANARWAYHNSCVDRHRDDWFGL